MAESALGQFSTVYKLATYLSLCAERVIFPQQNDVSCLLPGQPAIPVVTAGLFRESHLGPTEAGWGFFGQAGSEEGQA